MNRAAGRYTTFRDVVLTEAVRSFSAFIGRDDLVSSARWHWMIKDAPCVGVFQAQPFADIEDEASGCGVVVRLQLVFVAGPPGADHVDLLADWWSDWLMGKRPLAGVRGDSRWVTGDVVPVVEQVGGFAEFHDLAVQPLIASVSTLRSEIHRE